MDPTVSIIVPVYNAQDSLKRCVESILNQEYKALEVILVNDGSSDNSGKMCDGFAQKDDRVRVLHKANSGVSDSRNQAMAMARGEFIQFADSDDWITPDATRLMVRAARESGCDMVISDFYRVVGERVSRKGDIEKGGAMTVEEFASHMLEKPADFYYGVLWNKLYRRDLIEKYRLCMDPRISWCEDFMFNLEYIRHAGTIYVLCTPLYYYVRTKGSLVSQSFSLPRSIRMKRMVFEYYNNFYKHVLDETDYEKNRLQVYRFLIDAAGDGMVPPAIFPGSKKLGEERVSVSLPALCGTGQVKEIYRKRKLLEYYLRPAALRNNLSFEEAWVMLCIADFPVPCRKRELGDVCGLTGKRLSSCLSRLVGKGLIKVEEKRIEDVKGKFLFIEMTNKAGSVIDDFLIAEKDCEQAFFTGFSPEEQEMYETLAARGQANIREILQ